MSRKAETSCLTNPSDDFPINKPSKSQLNHNDGNIIHRPLRYRQLQQRPGNLVRFHVLLNDLLDELDVDEVPQPVAGYHDESVVEADLYLLDFWSDYQSRVLLETHVTECSGDGQQSSQTIEYDLTPSLSNLLMFYLILIY